MRTYLYPVSLLRRPIATPAEVSCIHCQGKQQCMWASATPGATLRLHSWAIRFSNSLNLERMMISVWGRSRNVSLIDYWKSSACYSHMAMLAWPMARKCLTATFFVVLHNRRNLSDSEKLKEGSAKHVIEGLLEHNFESLKSHFDKSYLIHRLISRSLSPVRQQWEWTQTSPRHSFVPWKWTVKFIYCLHSRAEIGYEYFVEMAEV